MFDVLIQNGRVVDGTGQTWFRASVGITEDTVTLLRGDTTSQARESGRVIDATNYVVCPGFIDMHSHSDLALLSQPQHEVKLRQGVTTEILGMDGLSYAPTSPANLEMLLVYLRAINGLPPENVRWSSVKEFLDLFDRRVSCNVGNSCLMRPSAWRLWVGRRGFQPWLSFPACKPWLVRPCGRALLDSPPD